MVVIVILGILATLTLFALTNARNTARERKTQATIATLNELLMERYESYKYRRVPIDTAGYDPRAAAALRLRGIRLLMMVEMPERWSEVGMSVDPEFRTALYHAYARRKTGTVSQDNQGAECLYMIITMGTGEGEALSLFGDSEIGDTDNDGAPEFLDAWGNPITFIRWAYGFSSESEIQPGGVTNDPDPFDPMRLQSGMRRLVPLIASAGLDQEFDLLRDNENRTFMYGTISIDGVNVINPLYPVFTENSQDFQVGEALDTDRFGRYRDSSGKLVGNGEDNSTDNIHNHLIGRK